VAVEVALSGDDDPRAFARWADRVEVRSRRAGDRLVVELKGPRFVLRDESGIALTVRVPRGMALAVDMGVGTLGVGGMARDVDLKLGIGEVDLRLAAAAVRNVDVDLSIGEASLEAGGRRTIDAASVFGGGWHWRDGRGASPAKVRLGIGEVAVVVD
jgi:hypothetical protein